MSNVYRFVLLISTIGLSACQSIPNASWDGYRKAEAVVLADSQLDQIDSSRNESRYKARATALTVIRTMRILGQNSK